MAQLGIKKDTDKWDDLSEARALEDFSIKVQALAELKLIRDLITSGEQLSDIQLFSQLKNLNEIRAALQAIDNDTARRMVGEIDVLLENVFASSKFG